MQPLSYGADRSMRSRFVSLNGSGTKKIPIISARNADPLLLNADALLQEELCKRINTHNTNAGRGEASS